MSRWELWQWHNLTAVGETEIIATANCQLVMEWEAAKRLISQPVRVISTIEQAQDYFCTHETGSVVENIDFKEDKTNA
jgi:hypothetical protein